ncbi:MAG: HAMP domain-containing protein [Deltaproteobacteria bacterium]|nr:HAMP domain-containing protein [Deltaproteobacteria bacterium]
MERLRRIFERLDQSLRARILVPTAFLFAGTLVAMVGSAVAFYGHDMEKGQHEKAELFANMLAQSIASTMLRGSPQAAGDVVAVVAGHRRDILSVSLIKPGGDVVGSTRPEMIGTRPWGSAVDQFLSPTVVNAPGGDSTVYAVVRPIPNGELCSVCHGEQRRVNGWLDMRFSRAPIVEQQQHLAQTMAFSAGAALIMLLAIAYWLLSREAVAPLQRLVTSMRQAEAGDLQVRADEGRTDELGVAARGFDQMLAALRRSQSELEAFYRERMVRADRFAAVGELATGLAHEIKNPLAGLSGALELLAEDLAQAPRQAEVVAEMRHQVTRLTHTMESLLHFARPPKPQLRAADVNETLEKVLFLVSQQRRAAPVEVKAQLDRSLPRVHGDPAQLEQVLLNLCLNASQAMASGGTLTVRSFAEEQRVTVEVQDTGPGIPDDVRPHIFKPFFTTKTEGNGLGLAISARIIAEHGGNIAYRCPPGGGTVFTITLNQAPVPPAAPAEQAA